MSFYVIYFPSPQLNVAVLEGPEICPKPASREVDEGKHRAWVAFKLPVNNSELGLASWAWELFSQAGSCTQKDPGLGLMLCILCLDNLDNF